jgi:hypothetical protein
MTGKSKRMLAFLYAVQKRGKEKGKRKRKKTTQEDGAGHPTGGSSSIRARGAPEEETQSDHRYDQRHDQRWRTRGPQSTADDTNGNPCPYSARP